MDIGCSKEAPPLIGGPRFRYGGGEFAGKALDTWAYTNGVKLDLIRPGKPAENGHIESFARVARTDGDVTIDCWMSWTGGYTIEMAEIPAPYSVYGMGSVGRAGPWLEF